VALKLLQYSDGGRTRVARVEDKDAVLPLAGVESTYQLAMKAANERRPLEQVAAAEAVEAPVAYTELLSEGRILPPLTHPDPSHCLVSGTGLTHLGSAAARDAMHAKIDKQDDALTDSMKMFKWGVEGGKPVGSKPGMQPEWFYKGDGRNVVGSGSPLASPDFAEDHGEEPELVGLYIIDENRRPRRLGFAIGNEFSDHITERRNYLLLAHSKLRQCGVGPMLNTGALPAHLEGVSRIRRDGAVLWQKPFLTGEANMCHTFANLEYHHFKVQTASPAGRRASAFLRHRDGEFRRQHRVQAGDEFEVDLPALGPPLVNKLLIEPGGLALHETAIL
jgi:hypothetical protein